ncbi:MAG: leucine-rich repeat domain-containing protein [Bacteroidaceae bacterium]|nr:leucine-rich repeat domain-containing protein [Bacteroidaceae bacterium]
MRKISYLMIMLMIGFVAISCSKDDEEKVEEEEIDSSIIAKGTCGENIDWVLDRDSVLTISGTGKMTDYIDMADPWYPHKTDIKAIKIEQGVTSIGNCAFSDCSSMTSIEIPNTVASIGSGAFVGCSALTSITIPNSVTDIGVYAFSGCSGLTAIEIPQSVTNIENMAFAGCTGLTSVTIPKSVTKFGTRVFIECDKLAELIVEDGNRNYDSRNNCNAIIETASNTLMAGCMNTSIPNTVSTIEFGAFWGCDGMNAIKIPSSVSDIKSLAFFDCRSLKSISVAWETPLNVPDDIFNSVPKAKCTLYVPNGTSNAYQSAKVWNEFQNIEEYPVK